MKLRNLAFPFYRCRVWFPFFCRAPVLLVLTLLLAACNQVNYEGESTPHPVIKNSLPSIDIQTIEPIGWDRKTPVVVSYSDCGRTWTDSAEAKFRGGMSSRYDKHSYSVELSGKYRPANLPADDDWILNANYIDKTFVRHKLSYDLFRQMGPNDLAAQCAYVELWRDSVYRGLYVVMEEVNAGMLGMDKKDTAAVVYKDPALFYPGRTGAVQDSTNHFGQKQPKKHIRDQTGQITAFQEFLFDSPTKPSRATSQGA